MDGDVHLVRTLAELSLGALVCCEGSLGDLLNLLGELLEILLGILEGFGVERGV